LKLARLRRKYSAEMVAPACRYFPQDAFPSRTGWCRSFAWDLRPSDAGIAVGKWPGQASRGRPSWPEAAR